MFIKIDNVAIINITNIICVRRVNDQTIQIDLKDTGDNSLFIRGSGKLVADKIADTDRTYNFIWDSICEYRKFQKDYEGIKEYI